MSYLYGKSPTWRWIVASCKASTGFFFVFGSLCIALPLALGHAAMWITNSNNQELEDRLSKLGRREAELVAKVNNERLGQLLTEVKEKQNIEDRYAAALRGETLTGTPGARLRGGAGTSWRPLPQQETVDQKDQSIPSTSAT